ncbi:hypothetical protein B0H14DRAFT_5211 [Mycena olivaceomarginata]|nr:hypothetical protein B0H14DRAFT_5211 [Mycena olivaceomarginata]
MPAFVCLPLHLPPCPQLVFPALPPPPRPVDASFLCLMPLTGSLLLPLPLYFYLSTRYMASVDSSHSKTPLFATRSFTLSRSVPVTTRSRYAVHERVPDFALYLIAIVAPIVLQAVINLLTIRSWWDLHNGAFILRSPRLTFCLLIVFIGWLGLVLGLSITGSITQFVKITVGRPRPDLIDRCQPIPGSVDPCLRTVKLIHMHQPERFPHYA